MAISATSSVWTLAPHLGNSAATIEPNPSVMPGRESSGPRVVGGIAADAGYAQPRANAEADHHEAERGQRDGGSPNDRQCVQAQRCANCSEEDQKNRGAPRRTAARSASPSGAEIFSMTSPAVTAASSGSKFCVVPTWLRSAQAMRTSVTSRPTYLT